MSTKTIPEGLAPVLNHECAGTLAAVKAMVVAGFPITGWKDTGRNVLKVFFFREGALNPHSLYVVGTVAVRRYLDKVEC